MNNDRRKTLVAVQASLETAQNEFKQINWDSMKEDLLVIKEEIESVKDEEQEAFENMSEGLQQTERGERMSEVVDQLDNACSSIDEVVEKLTEASVMADMINNIIGEIESAVE